MKRIRKLTTVKLLLAALAITCLFAGRTNAQQAFTSEFTLPFEVQWGLAVLPAGEYRVTGDHSGTVDIQEAKSGKFVAHVRCGIREDSRKGHSALLIATRGGQKVVHSLRLAVLGVTFIYDPALARNPEIMEAHKTQAVPLVTAKK